MAWATRHNKPSSKPAWKDRETRPDLPGTLAERRRRQRQQEALVREAMRTVDQAVAEAGKKPVRRRKPKTS